MGWGRFLLGDLGQQLDIHDQGESLRRLRQSVAHRHSKDMDQDAELAALWQENVNLKLGLAALVQLLVERGVVGHEEIAKVVAVLEQAESPAPGASAGVASEADATPTSPELDALADAARENFRRPRG